MNLKSFILTISAILLLILAAVGGYFLSQLPSQPQPNPSPTPSQSSLPSPLPPTQSSPSSVIPSDWQTYKNTTHGFAISYPPTYQALDDANNLYGWPNGVVLLYNGGQSYDVIIEVWNTQADYQAKYSSGNFDLTVKKIGNKYLTLLNSTQEDQNSAIISTFESLTP